MVGQTLDGRYRIIRRLGQGGFGQTFLAADTRRPGEPVCVIKRLHLAQQDQTFLAVARRLFRSEAESLEKLGRHDQIPRLLAFFEENQQFFLAQEWIEGETLSAELPLGQRWSEPQVIAMLEDVLQVLAYIHGQGVIHRDIKPDNLIRRASDRKLVLVDFGSVKQVSSQTLLVHGQLSGTVAVGTPGYMAAEQSQGKPRPSSDLYALGVIAIQALTGMVPAQLREDVDGELVWRDQADVSPALAEILTRMVRHYFKLRYQTAEQVLQTLAQWSASPGDGGRHRPPDLRVEFPPHTRNTVVESTALQRQQTHRKGSLMPLILGGGLAGLAIAGGIFAFSPQLLTAIPWGNPSLAPDDGPTRFNAAQATAQTGDLGRAITIAQAIPERSRAYQPAQMAIQAWQPQWQQQQTLYRRLQEAQQARRWQEVRQLAPQFPTKPYWQERLTPITQQAERELNQRKRVRPRPRPKLKRKSQPKPTPKPQPTPKPSSPTPSPAPDPTASPDVPISPSPVPSSSPTPTEPAGSQTSPTPAPETPTTSPGSPTASPTPPPRSPSPILRPPSPSIPQVPSRTPSQGTIPPQTPTNTQSALDQD